jgi:aspartyl-tRNA(Asn)/glutamyl-tRNA(Gln) amidotransferase subunit A
MERFSFLVMKMSELLDLDATDLIAAIASGECQTETVWQTYRQRAEKDPYGAIIWLAGNDVPDYHDRPLAGIPLGVKDLFCVKGVPTQAASAILQGYCPPYSATVVERLDKAGAPMLCRTNMDEFGMGGSTENSSLGLTRNPWNSDYVPGGSSGGSAAAVAGGLIPWALGSDTGGSIRQPASFCGIVGLKPTYGSCSRRGMIAFASSLDCPGPMTRTVRDCALLFGAMTGEDTADPTSIAAPTPFTPTHYKDLRGLRFGVIAELSGEGIDPQVQAALTSTCQRIRQLGGEVVECSLPVIEHAVAAYYLLASAEASTNLARYDGIRFGQRRPASTTNETYIATRSALFGPEVQRRIMIGTFALSAGYAEAYYGSAQRVRTLICRAFAQALAEVDCLLAPSAPTPAYRLGSLIDDPLQMYLSDLCTIPVSLAGLPALSLPMGVTSNHLPMGLQLIGASFTESLLLGIGETIEAVTPMPERPWSRYV